MLINRDSQTVLRSPFNVTTHKETFINYLEVIILENGEIEYAIPSHRVKVTEIIAKKRNISMDEVADLCPREFYLDYYFWLCREANALMVWNNFYTGKPNDAQLKSLLMLMEEGLYNGNVDVDRLY